MKTASIYILVSALFAPAALMFVAGCVLIPQAVILDLAKGNFQTLGLLLPLVGGGVGLIAAFILTAELTGIQMNPDTSSLARVGLVLGASAESVVYLYVQPEIVPTLVYWLPPILGAILLFIASVTCSANKRLQSDAQART